MEMDSKRTVTRSKTKSEENFVKMEEIRNRLKMSKSDFSIALGYVTSGGYEASTKKGANLMQLLAAEGVEMRYAGKSSQRPVCYTLFAVHPDGKVDVIPVGGSPQTVNIMGRDYLLIPRK
jgi:hypothetical protein